VTLYKAVHGVVPPAGGSLHTFSLPGRPTPF
jgi:hypothetical protein